MAVSYVGIDTQGARALGQVLQETAGRVDGVRRSVSAALDLADLDSQVPAELARVQDGFTTLATGVTDKAALAEQFAIDPQRTAASLGAPVDTLGAVISGLLGFAGPSDLRQVLVGLPPPGADPALDAALARLNPVLMPAFQAGQRPELTEAQAADLKLLALSLGIEHAGPPVAPVTPVTGDDEGVAFWGRSVARTALPARSPLLAWRPQQQRTGTEVFWNDFWTGGRTVDSVLADPALLMEWVAGTFELDRRLALATGLPSLGDVLTSVDFATTGSDPGELAAILAAAETEFAAIADWLPAFLVGQDSTAPDATQLAQTLAFAARVGWPDPGAGAAGEQERFADAIAFLRANRALQSALLPTGFEGDPDPLAFFNAPGIGFVLDLGRRTGVLDTAVLGTIGATVDQALAAFGVDMSGPTPAELTEQFQQQLVALLATQIPRSMLEKPATQAQFVAAFGFLRSAATGPEQRQRLIDVLAAFRTLAVTGAPALTERQLVAAVGQQVQDVLGRSRLRARSQDAVRKNPEFLLVARQWGLPGSKKQDLGKYKFSWSFNDLGELTGIRRKKKSWLSRVWDTIKAVGQAIWDSWEENPLKAIFQIGKIALGVAAFFVPGLQGLGLGAVSFALNAGEAIFNAAQGDWLGALASGLSAFTAGAKDVFSPVAATVVETSQHEFVKTLFGTDGLFSSDALSLLKNGKRAFDIGSAIFNVTQAPTLVGAIGAGLGAAVTTLGSGGQLLAGLDPKNQDLARLAQDLVRVGVSVGDVARIVTPAAGLVDALDRDDDLAAFGNGLSIIAAGARVVSNERGAFAGPNPPLGGVFGFNEETQAALKTFSQGAGVAGNVTLAINAADRGDTFQSGVFLAQAVQALNDPTTTVVGSRALVAQRIAEVGVLLEAVFDRRANPTAVAPVVLQRLQAVLNATNTPLRETKEKTTEPAGPTPARPAPAAGTATTSSLTQVPGATLVRPGQERTQLFAGTVPGTAPTTPVERIEDPFSFLSETPVAGATAPVVAPTPDPFWFPFGQFAPEAAAGANVSPVVSTAAGPPDGRMSLGGPEPLVVPATEPAPPAQISPAFQLASAPAVGTDDSPAADDGSSVVPTGATGTTLLADPARGHTEPQIVVADADAGSRGSAEPSTSYISRAANFLADLIVPRAAAAEIPEEVKLQPIDRGVPVPYVQIDIGGGGDSFGAYTGITSNRSGPNITLPWGLGSFGVWDSSLRSADSPMEAAVQMLRDKYGDKYVINFDNASESGATPTSMLNPTDAWFWGLRPAQADAFVNKDIGLIWIGGNPGAFQIGKGLMTPWPVGDVQWWPSSWPSSWWPWVDRARLDELTEQAFQKYNDQLTDGRLNADMERMYDTIIPLMRPGGAVLTATYPEFFSPTTPTWLVTPRMAELYNGYIHNLNGQLRVANDEARDWWAPDYSVGQADLSSVLKDYPFGGDPSAVNFLTWDLLAGALHPNRLAVPPLADGLFKELEPIFLEQVHRKYDEMLGRTQPPDLPSQRPFIDPGRRTEADQVWTLVTGPDGELRYQFSAPLEQRADTGQPGPIQLTSAPEQAAGEGASGQQSWSLVTGADGEIGYQLSNVTGEPGPIQPTSGSYMEGNWLTDFNQQLADLGNASLGTDFLTQNLGTASGAEYTDLASFTGVNLAKLAGLTDTYFTETPVDAASNLAGNASGFTGAIDVGSYVNQYVSDFSNMPVDVAYNDAYYGAEYAG